MGTQHRAGAKPSPKNPEPEFAAAIFHSLALLQDSRRLPEEFGSSLTVATDYLVPGISNYRSAAAVPAAAIAFQFIAKCVATWLRHR